MLYITKGKRSFDLACSNCGKCIRTNVQVIELSDLDEDCIHCGADLFTYYRPNNVSSPTLRGDGGGAIAPPHVLVPASANPAKEAGKVTPGGICFMCKMPVPVGNVCDVCGMML